MKLEELKPIFYDDTLGITRCAQRLRSAVREQQQLKETYQIDEGLIRTLDRKKTLVVLKRNFPKFNIHLDDNNTFSVAVIHPTEEVVTKLTQFLNNLGWFMSIIQIDNTDVRRKSDELSDIIQNQKFERGIILYYEAKYDIPSTPSNKSLYHLTPTHNLSKIMKIGLVPRSLSNKTYHPERVYLTYSDKNALAILNDLNSYYKFTEWDPETQELKEVPNKWTLLKVDISNLNYLKLYQDPNFTMGKKYLGVYALSGIPPRAIQVVREITM